MPSRNLPGVLPKDPLLQRYQRDLQRYVDEIRGSADASAADVIVAQAQADLALATALAAGGGGVDIEVELKPSSKIDSGFTWGGAVVYWENFNGSTLTNALSLATGVNEMVGYVSGWVTTSGGNHYGLPYGFSTTRVKVYKTSGGVLTTAVAGSFLNQAFDFTMAYT